MSEFSFSNIIELLEKANEQGVKVSFAEGALSVHVPKGKQIDKGLLNELKESKPFLIDYFKNFENNNSKGDVQPIPKIDRSEIKNIPLSFAQERLWFIHQLEGTVRYHLPTVLRLKGNLNCEVLEQTLQSIINRHEVLRTVILEENGRGYQHIREENLWQLNIVDGTLYNKDAEALQQYIHQLISAPFNLAKDDMIRAVLIKMHTDEHVLVVTMHHIASDAWSKFVLVREVAELYSALMQGRADNLPTLAIQYADYANWQRTYLKEDVLQNKLDYWKNKLEGVETLELPTDHVRPVVRSDKGNSVSFNIDKEVGGLLQKLSQQEGATLFMILLAVYKVMLYRYTSQRDICVGTSFARRDQQELEGLIGFFVNTLALRDELGPASSFIELLRHVKTTTLGAYEHQDIPFEKVVELVVRERDTSKNPLFQVMLVWVTTPEVTDLKLGDLEILPEAFEQNTTKFDLTFFITETPKGLQGSVQYSTDLYKSETVERMIGHFQQLLSSVVKGPKQQTGLLNMLGKDEEHWLLNEFNSSTVAYPAGKSITDLFEEQALAIPNNLALVFGEETLSYRQLNERSNQLAHYLKSMGVNNNSLVPLYVERSAAMIVGLLGIIKSGAAYVPVDTDLPAERLGHLLEEIASSILVTSTQCRQKLSGAAEIKTITIDGEELKGQPVRNLAEKVLPNQLAYVIYTSGSTGKPKGVMISHKNLADYYFGLNNAIQTDQCNSFALVSSIATDLGNTVIYAALLSGGSLHVFSKGSVSDIEYLHKYFTEYKIDCLKIVPAHWKALCPTEKLLLPQKLLIFGGEALQKELTDIIFSSGSHCRVVNHYGPTETTIGKLLHEVKPGGNYNKTIPVGKPFSNTSVYVLSNEMQLCPAGIPGQLFIAGEGVAAGYYKNAALSKEKFITDPFSAITGAKMYGTGDLVKWLEDGNIAFIGRTDDQVKIRGYRVEPGEIESVLQQSEQISQAVVLAKEDKQGNKILVAYLITKKDFDKEVVVSFLKKQLPDHMIPAVFIEMETFPLTANGKINRKLLPDADSAGSTGNQYVAPRNGTEAKLAEIWQDVLELEPVGVHDDFFELGGHSLLAVRLISAIRKTFTVEMPISDIFDYPTVAGLAEQVGKQSGRKVMASINPLQPRPTLIPLSFSQERLWFLDRLEGTVQYHVPAVLHLNGDLNIEALKYAFGSIVNRHDVLRSVIREQEGQAYQFVKDPGNWKLSVVDGASYKENETILKEYIRQLVAKPFDLSNDDMLRVVLIRINEAKHILVATLHHIASDGWSKSILVKELIELYNASDENRPPKLLPLQVQYADHAIWQRANFCGDLFETKISYWKKKLQGVVPVGLPTDYQRPAFISTQGAVLHFDVDLGLSDQLAKLGQSQGATLFMTLLSAFKILLFRYSGNRDICVGTPIAGRQQTEVEGLIGFFVNTLALRNEINGNHSFNEILQQVRTGTLEAYENQEVPFEKIVEMVVKERDLGRNPIFQVLFVLQNAPGIEQLRLGKVVLGTADLDHNSSKFDLTFIVTETSKGLSFSIEYSTALYAAETIKRMQLHFTQLLSSLVQAPGQSISSLQMLGKQEEQRLLIEFNNTSVAYPGEKNIVASFEKQVLKTPDSTALVFNRSELTYKALNERSNQLAHYLLSKGVKAETLVPICIERSLDMIVVILGILKAGCAYVPTDPTYPAERISFMIQDTGSPLIVSSRQSRHKLSAVSGIEIIEMDGEHLPAISCQPHTNPQIFIRPDQLAYIIYTSGSTGRPKGVMIEHSGVVNLINAQNAFFNITSDERILQFSNYCFDASVEQIFLALFNGAALILIPEGLQLNVAGFEDLLIEEKISHLHATPSFIENLHAAKFKNLKRVIAGGDTCKKELSLIWKNKADFYNEYGPTETTVTSVEYHVELDGATGFNTLPVGKPIANTQLYILDIHKALLPIGVPGELYVAGAGVARGYLNLPELTAQKFINDPFGEDENNRMYKTGDVARWLPDGNIEFIGRLDDQVKIRGYRIELGEIESVLLQSEMLKQAVVLARDYSAGNRRLVGYIVLKEGFEKAAVTNWLEGKLPTYMIPGSWVELEAMPITPNGKIDKNALPDADASRLSANEYVAPRNEFEFKMAAIWKELLLVEQVGINDHFFELGGHSLLVMRLVAAVRKQLDTEVAIKDIFLHPTLAGFTSHLLLQGKGLLLPAIELKPRPDRIPLSFSQQRLWFIDQMEGSIPYHIPGVLRLKGNINKAALQNALQTIVARHEVLRTIFLEHNGDTHQFVRGAGEWNLSVADGSNYSGDTGRLQQYVKQLIAEPFDLSKDYMLRASLVDLAGPDHLLVVTLHHIAADGWSVSIILKELASLYRSFNEDKQIELAPIQIQYADYAIWQRNYLQGDVLATKLNYWKEKLHGAAPLQLPTDYARPAFKRNKGNVKAFKIDKELAEALVKLSYQQGTTIFMTLLAAFKVLLYRYSGQQDICVGSPVANRSQQEVESLVGFFVNTLALRSKVNGKVTFTHLLKEIKATMLEAYSHQEVPFEKVVEAVVKERDMSRSPLFQVMFVLQNLPGPGEIDLGEVELSVEAFAHDTSKFDLTLNIRQSNDGLHGLLEYCTDLYNENTIGLMIGHFKELLFSIVKDPLQMVGVLPMLSGAEEHQLLFEFNDTVISYQPESIISLFEKQAAKTPEAIALVFEGMEISYHQLNEHSNQLAHYLLGCGVKKESLIPICIERSIEMIVGILAVLKSGGAYIPIDPEYPVERIQYMLEDTAATIMLSSKAARLKLPGSVGITIIELDKDRIEASGQPVINLHVIINPKQLAYVIYTSGSTGKPKGVMVEHAGVVNLVKSISDKVGFNPACSLLSVTTFSFDICYLEFFMPLVCGGKLIVISRETAMDGFGLAKELALYHPTHMQGTPSTWQLLLEADWQNKEGIKILIGGEAIKENLKDSLTHTGDVFNLYGPTETTIWSAFKQLSAIEKVLIGKPVSNTAIYILNEEQQLCPPGVSGEICIGGAGLARGYLNRAGLTAEKFINNPFGKREGARLYRTGDLGRWLHDGNIDCLGRVDDQVKIRGYRIELGEIETVLLQSGMVDQAVISAKEDRAGNHQLVGYVVSGNGFDKAAVISWLNGKLPAYMIPALWVLLDSMPLTANGKIDKKALPNPGASEMPGNEHVAPRNELEEKVAAIWKDLLQVKQPGIFDNFFELGGHSLLAMRVIAAIRNQMGIELTIKGLFVHPDIASLAAHIQSKNKLLLLPAIENVTPRPNLIPLSFSQERLWFIDQMGGSIQYHLAFVLRLKGALNTGALSSALNEIVNRHEVLRTVIREQDGQAWQFIKEKDHWQLSIIDGTKYAPSDMETYLQQAISTPFNLAKDHMFRASLITLNSGDHILLAVTHHISSDAWSLSILADEVTALYSAFENGSSTELTPLPIQYADYSIWQRTHLYGGLLDAKLEYWKTKLEDVSPLLLPTDFKRPLFSRNNGATTNFTLDKQTLQALHKLSRQQSSTLFMTLFAAFNVLVHRYSRQQDICIGTSVANRSQQEIERLIGFFVNMVPLRNEVKDDQPFTGLLQQIKTTTLDAYEHQEVPFEKIVDAVVKEREIGRNPVIQVMFVLLNTPVASEINVGNLTLLKESFAGTTAQFDLSFLMRETPEGLHGSVQYSTGLYRPETIISMIAHFTGLLNSIIKDPSQQIGMLGMLTAQEEKQLTVEFNGTTAAYPNDKSLIDLFEEQVLKTPGAIALVFEEEQLTYRELNLRASQVANYLIEKGIQPSQNIGLLAVRSAEMIIAMFGILKAGAVYVPFNKEYPAERLKYIIEDAAIKIILSTNKELIQASGLGEYECIEIKDALLSSTKNPGVKVDIDSCVYIMHTSGTTGHPKGIRVSNRNVIKLVYDAGAIAVMPGDRVLQWSNYSFDGSTYDIYSSLLTGAGLYLVKDDWAADIDALSRMIQEQKITVCFITTALFNTFIDVDAAIFSGLRKILFGGENVSLPHVEKALSILGPGKIVHVYGPTETTVYATSFSIDSMPTDGIIPIGKPLSNTSLLVLNENAQLVPVGVPGELYIGGDGVSLGYINNSGLSSEKFVGNPLSPQNKEDRYYRSGDLVRWLPAGQIEFLGRIDNQVKIRGYRIELGEIESVLMQSSLIRQAIVVANEDKQGTKRLVSYLVAEGHFDKQAIISFLSGKLPGYMIPVLWVALENFPLTPNGKIDRKALPDPDAGELLSNEFIAPRNELEISIAEIWKDLLDIDQVSINDNFFDLGGHSLLAIRVISAIRKNLNVELIINDIFDHPTIQSLANQLAKNSEKTTTASIEVAMPRPQRIPLSFSQQRLWFIDRLEGSLQYHVPAVIRLKGNLNKDALSYVMRTVVNRHEILRTVFLEDEGGPYQHIKDEDGWVLETVDGLAFKEDQQGLKDLIKKLIGQPFDLTNDYMVRAVLISLEEQEHILVVTQHHIASDAWSASILVKEILELYGSYIEGRKPALAPLRIQYADYAIWQRNYLKGEMLDKKLAYWENKLEGVTRLQLPTDHQRPSFQSISGASKVFTIDKALSGKILDLCQQQSATLFMTLLAAFKVLLHRYSGQQDICVGTSVANRTQQEVEGLIGFFVNTLALRDEVKSDRSFTELLQKVKQTTLQAYAHQEVPFEKVVEKVVKDRDAAVSPLFQVMLVLANTPEVPVLQIGGLELSGEPFSSNISKFELTFFITNTPHGIHGTVQYSDKLFNGQTIDGMVVHFIELLASVVKNPEQKTGKLQMLAGAEKEQLLIGSNRSTVIYPKDKSVADLFEQQVIKTPDQVAIVFENEALTYQQLNAKSNQLAHYLRGRGVEGESLVPLCLERGLDMIVGIIGILKAGGAYVPVDIDFPAERIRFMLEDTGAAVIVSSQQARVKLPEGVAAGIVEIDGAALMQQPTGNLNTKVAPHQLAYVIYTSGSTGRPKGVMIEHRSLVDYVFGLDQKVQASACHSFALVSTIATDLGNTVIYSSLLSGAALHIFSKETISDPALLHNYFRKHAIECLKIVPSHWKALSMDERLLLPKKLLVFGGEALQAGLVEEIRLSATNCRIVNHYGPTETTIGKLLHIVGHQTTYSNTIPIGKAFSNTSIYVLSKELELCPLGVPGQLYIGGDGIGRGYFNNPELTADKFIANPFDQDGNTPRIYATGDLVKYLPDGNILFTGRVDDQVKIRGFRIELGEIEMVLHQHQLINNAVVLARENKQRDKSLIAYIVAEDGFNKDEIVSYLKDRVPGYMIPSVIIEMQTLPLTANGKIDRKALPDPDTMDLMSDGCVAPRNETESKIAAIWIELLEIDQVGVHDNFFTLGGHSLLAVRLISALRKGFSTDLPISDIFDYPTIASLAGRIENNGSAPLPPIEATVPHPGLIPLSFGQQRLWFIDQLEGSVPYNSPNVLRLKGKVNKDAISYALKQIISRHEILRTVFYEIDGNPYQKIIDNGQWQMSCMDGARFQSDKTGLKNLIEELISAPFDLSKDYMLRADLLMLEEEVYILVVTMHHIAYDAWSLPVIVKEVMELYEAFEEGRPARLVPLAIQYADYALWQRKYLEGEVLSKKTAYWKTKLEGVTPLQLPTDFKRPAIRTINGSTIQFTIGKELSNQVDQLCLQQGTTLFMTLLAAYKILLHRYCNQQDICVGASIANRPQVELEGLVGFFVNTIALRTHVIETATFADFLQQVKNTTLQAYEHQQVPFEKVVEEVVKERDPSISPLFQVMLVLLNTPGSSKLGVSGVELINEPVEINISKFDITFHVSQSVNGLSILIVYNNDLFREDTINRMAGHFTQLLMSIVNDPGQAIEALQMLTEAEEQQLLMDFN